MNILVAGGAGYIGSITTTALLEQGHRVTVLDNLSKGHRAAVPPGAEFIQADLADAEIIQGVCREHHITLAMHFAAFIEVGESVSEPARYFENNFVRTKAFLDALLEAGVGRFVFSSTAAVYGEPREIPIPEEHPRNPTSPYGWSKLFVEQLLAAYAAARGLRYVVFRYFNAAGCESERGEDHRPETHLIPLVLQVALGQRPHISIFGSDWPTPDGTCIRDYIHVSDLAGAHVAAAEALGQGHPGGIFNLGNGEGYSVAEVIEAARDITGHAIPAVHAPRRPGDPARLVASSQRARAEFGWTPRRTDLRDIIASAWEWKRRNPEGYKDSA